MKLTIFSASCVGNPANALYPNKAEIENKEDMLAVISRDHVCAEFKNCHRSIDDFSKYLIKGAFVFLLLE